MVGVNQVIMLSLNMVIIASMIGAGGLGHDVLAALRRLDFGAGLEAAWASPCSRSRRIALSQAFAQAATVGPWQGPEPSFVRRHPHLVIALALLLGGWALAAIWLAAHLSRPSPGDHGGTVNAGMEWINIHLFDAIEAVKSWPPASAVLIKRPLLGLPWPAVVAAVALAGWQLGGTRLPQTGAPALFIALTGNWLNGMETVYLCGLSVIIACLIGIPIGVWAARSERVHRVAQAVVDTCRRCPRSPI